MPAVSVIVIGYNDSANLPIAVRSVFAQTMTDLEVILVDDGSSDDTPAVAGRLAAADSRVRLVRLESNSGGCSRPRNTGLEFATGDYVTFLDSDDTLTSHACARLLAAAQRTKADMVCGRFVRRHHHPRRHLGAHDDLYLRPAVLDGILDRPRQLFDTPACSKLYRRQFLADERLRFPEGLFYEDLLFTTQAYCAARRIAVIPDLVYIWNVRRGGDELSISNRRELRNWHDRFEIHRRIDAYLTEREAPTALQAAKDYKFFTVDFPLFLREFRLFPAAERRALLGLATRYLAERSAPLPVGLPAATRVGAFLAAIGDEERTPAAADFSATGGVASDLTPRGERLLWTSAHLDQPDAERHLDVTDTGWLTASAANWPLLAHVTEAAVEGRSLSLTGVVHDPLHRLASPEAQRVDGRLVVTGRVGGRLWSAPLRLTPSLQGVGFTTSLDLAAIGRRLMSPTVGPELRLSVTLSSAAGTVRRRLTARDARLPEGAIALPSPWRRLVGGHGRLAEVNGRLVIQLTDLPVRFDAALDAASRLRLAGRRALARLR